MKFPLKMVTVAGHRIPVKLVSPEALNGDDGEYNYNTKAIGLNKTLAPEKLLPTLKHEMRHCVLDLSGASGWLSRESEEQIVMAFENLFDVAWDKVLARMEKAKPPVAPTA